MVQALNPGEQNRKKLFAFDFDGTLVDSYICLPYVYASIAHRIGLNGDFIGKFVDEMIKGEDKQDLLRSFNRHEWWPTVFEQFDIHLSRESLIQLVKIYWDERAKNSKIIGSGEQLLNMLKSGALLTSISGGDGKYGNKKERIQKSGLGIYFEEIVVIGEDVQNLTQAVLLLIDKYCLTEDKVIVIDDKPFPINEMSRNLKKVMTIKIEYEGILKLAWAEECSPDYKIRTVDEIRDIVTKIL